MIKNLLLSLIVFIFCACKGKEKEGEQFREVTLTIGSYTVNKEVFQKEILPKFRNYIKKLNGTTVKFEESYQASGAQSRAIAAGFQSDVATLSLEEDIERLVQSGLVSQDWKSKPHSGFVSNSVVAFAVRKGNPKNIKDWEDLTRDDVDVLYPNPQTSGGAMWCVNAIYGAGLKISEKRMGKPDPQFAENLLERIQKRVKVMDKSGRESYTTFERGIGDVAVTYENEVLLRLKNGANDVEVIVPEATILIQNPAAVVTAYASKHGVLDVANLFVDFLHSKQSQRAFAEYGFRPVDPEVEQEVKNRYTAPTMLFDVKYLGGWKKVREDIYGKSGVFTKILERVAREK